MPTVYGACGSSPQRPERLSRCVYPSDPSAMWFRRRSAVRAAPGRCVAARTSERRAPRGSRAAAARRASLLSVHSWSSRAAIGPAPCLMHEVDQDADCDIAACRSGFDEVELVAGAVDEEEPGPVTTGVAVACLGERLGDHVVRIVDLIHVPPKVRLVRAAPPAHGEAALTAWPKPATGRIHRPDVTYTDCGGAPEAPAGEGKAAPRRMACSAGVARRIHAGASAA